jgi:hypothetical protein
LARTRIATIAAPLSFVGGTVALQAHGNGECRHEALAEPLIASRSLRLRELPKSRAASGVICPPSAAVCALDITFKASSRGGSLLPMRRIARGKHVVRIRADPSH